MSKIIIIRELWGWQVKEFNGEVPTDKFFKIFETREDANKYIDEQEDL